MKKFMVALGIAFALIIGAFVGSTTMTAEAAVEPEPLTVEEAVANWAADNWDSDDIENVEVHDIEKDSNYGGWKVLASYDHDGTRWFTSISTESLDEFQL